MSARLDKGGRKMPSACTAFVVALLCWAPGCATSGGTDPSKEQFAALVQPFYPAYGAVAVKDLKKEYEPPPVVAAKTWDLAKLARATDAEHHFVPGDLLQVTCSDLVEEAHMETFPVHVAEDGTITLPLLSQRLAIGSLTAAEAEQDIRAAYLAAGLIRQPQLTIRTLEHKTHTIYVIGAVKKPGAYELQPEDCDPLRAIVAAGGATEDATSIVEVRRGGKRAPRPGLKTASNQQVGKPGDLTLVAAKFPADEEIQRFDLTKDIPRNTSQLQLQNGDIVSVEQKKLKPVYVAGSVNKPGEFPMPVDRDIRVLEAIGLAGGVLSLSEPTTALVTRRAKSKDALVIFVNLDRAAKHPEENPRLMEGDVVSVVEDAGSRFRKALRTFLNLGLSLPVPL